ncbi:hypothetical protein DTL42_09715 [Bremerella cremea]|uniref:Uncharacterized protein n=1 Tax=Bremerella cremea TaxID=1031537 RepID=A0A368KSG2_9BACT|nr:hypothetical protein DTL42_09715 [Bremerella cremea]
MEPVLAVIFGAILVLRDHAVLNQGLGLRTTAIAFGFKVSGLFGSDTNLQIFHPLPIGEGRS